MSVNLENSAVATGLERVSFHSLRKAMPNEWSNYHTTALISHTRKGMLKILHVRIPDVQAGFRKGRGISDQIANISWIIEKAREFQKKNPLLLH